MNTVALNDHFTQGEFISVTTINNSVIEGDFVSADSNFIILKSKHSTRLLASEHVLLVEKFNVVYNTNHQVLTDVEEDFIDMPANVVIQEVIPEQQLPPAESANIPFDSFTLREIPWKEDGYPEGGIFKGRNDLIDKLIKHYKSQDRTKTYMLYGLTRTGKSTILKYLDDAILNETVTLEKPYKFISFIWDLSRAASQSTAEDMWYYLLGNCTADKVKKLIKEEKIILPSADILYEKKYRYKHFREMVMFLKKNGYFPIILIDEFTYYENLANRQKLDSSFLQSLRQFSFDKLSCFVYAGAYNLKRLLKSKQYGLTGQFVNVKEQVVNQIDPASAGELINVFDKITFDIEARERIFLLSNRIPYFIQIICKNMGYYCYENKVNKVGVKDVEFVVGILTGNIRSENETSVERLSSGTFDNNQYDPTNEVNVALLVTIAHLDSSYPYPEGVQYNQITELWSKCSVKFFSELGDSIEDLMDRGIIVTVGDNAVVPRYRIGVDLFRRWLCNEKPDIQLVLGKINHVTYA
ncbi:MAG TPA: hypothetical protein VG738_19175 [Chitinophagaceae bacterium]|nr:hypothetical protein [Chitinophagaceae bacterium]